MIDLISYFVLGGGGWWMICDGLFSISLYRTQPLIPDQAVRIMIISGWILLNA